MKTLQYTFLILVLLSGYSQVIKGQTDSLSSKKGEDVDLMCKSMLEAFMQTLTFANRQPGGLVIRQSSCVNYNVDKLKEFQATPLEKGLDSITQANPQYIWTNEQGVINLLPIGYEPELLNTRIEKFEASLNSNLNLVVGKLLKLPEVEENLRKLNLKEGMGFGGLTAPPIKRAELKLSLENVTLRQALNEIVRKRGRGVWSYSEFYFNGSDRFRIDFLFQ